MLTTALFWSILSIAASNPVLSVQNSAELRQALSRARLGTTIEIAAGVYEGGIFASNLHGSATQPITIKGKSPADPPIFRGGGTGIHFSSVSHIVLENLRIQKASANGINIDDGGNRTKPSTNIRLVDVMVEDLPKGNHDGIKLSGVRDFTLTRVRVENWGGSGIDMVGCHNGLIELGIFENGGDNAIQTKGGSSNITIEKCDFLNAGQRGVNIGGSTGFEFFRPTLEQMPANARYEAKNITVQGCFFRGGTAAAAFVGVDGATFGFNTIIHPGKWAFRILQETRDPSFLPARNGVVRRNLIVFLAAQWGEGGVNVGPGTDPSSFKFEQNFWYCTDRPAASRPKLPTPESGGVFGVDPMVFANLSRADTVRDGSPAKKVGAHAFPG